MRPLKVIIVLQLIFSGYVLALVNGEPADANDWRSVVLLELIDPDNGQRSSCTAVIVSKLYAITTASCVLHEESGRQVSKVKVCIGQKRPFKGKNQGCIESAEIYSHHNFINNSGTASAYNLAYIKFKSAIDLQKYNIRPASLISPEEFTKLISKPVFPVISWVGFDANSLRNPVLGVKQQGTVSAAEFDYQSGSIHVKSSRIRPGNRYQGLASFIQTDNGQWQLIGLVSQSTPDNLVIYYPEFNPCDEDPIPVQYPKPIMEVTTQITPYPIAACAMAGFLESPGYSELACKKLLTRNLDWSRAIAREEPAALRQKAISIYQNNQSTDDAGEIYKLLYLALKAGDEDAAIILAQFLQDGVLFNKDIAKARQLIVGLVEKNNPAANLLLAKIMLFPKADTELLSSTESNDQQILALLEKAGNAGLAEAQYLLARLYQLGIGTKKSAYKAYQWHALAAMQGYADSQYQLGMQWNDGRGVRAYPEIALFWIQQAAAQGQLDAQNYLGLLKR